MAPHTGDAGRGASAAAAAAAAGTAAVSLASEGPGRADPAVPSSLTMAGDTGAVVPVAWAVLLLVALPGVPGLAGIALLMLPLLMPAAVCVPTGPSSRAWGCSFFCCS